MFRIHSKEPPSCHTLNVHLEIVLIRSSKLSRSVYNACANVTQLLKRSNTTDKGYYGFNWSLPNGFNTGSISNADDGSAPVFSASPKFQPITLTAGFPILNTSAVYPVVTQDDKYVDTMPLNATAEECMLYWCVQKYRSSMTGGILEEIPVATTKEGGDDVGDLYHFRPSDSNASLYLNQNWTQNMNSAFGTYPSGWMNGTFLVNKNASLLLTNYISPLVDGIATVDAPINDGVTTSDTVRRLNSGSLKNIFDLMALTMTTVVRNATNPARPKGTMAGQVEPSIVGKQHDTVIYITVRWWWLTLPVALELFAAILLLSTVTSATTNKVAIWKSSALAVLFHGITEEYLVTSANHSVERIVDMDIAAKRNRVVLEPTDKNRQVLKTWDKIDASS